MENLKELKELASELSVLYVEDDTDIANTIINYLSKFFKEVLYASNGEDGLKLYKQNPCDLVITDIRMPKMNGLDMTYEIKQINPHQNVVIISAYSEITNFISSIKLGVDGYVLKPVDYNDMNQLLFKMANRIKTSKYNEIYLNRVNNLIEELNITNAELQHYTDALNKVAIVSKADTKGYITFVNDFFCDIAGYTREELIGKNHNIVRHPDMPKSVFKELWSTIQNGKTWEGDLKNRRKDGEPYYVHATIIPLLNWDQETVREYIGIRFLTTADEQEKREFKKKVMLSYQGFRKENYHYQKRIKELEEELFKIKSEEQYLKNTSYESKSKQHQLLNQIKFYEKEIQKTHENHSKALEKMNENNKSLAQSYKKALHMVDQQKEKINTFIEAKEVQSKEILRLNEQLNEQRKVIADLHDTIKNIQEDDQDPKKKSLLKKFL